MRLLASFSLLFFSMSAFSQKKADMRIIDAELINDTLTLRYSIKNISPNSFAYYVPGINDFKYYLVGVSLFDVNKNKNYKFKVQPGGELDKLTVNKDKCVNISPGDSVVCKLSMSVDSFYFKKELSNNLSITFSIFYEYGLVWCTDCSHKLLTENLFGEKKILILANNKAASQVN